MIDIDIVYLWVNGNDPEWIAKKNAFIGVTTDSTENCEGRYADSGELKYSLRSVEKYAPWIRKVFIVTDNQVPEWLDTSNPKVQIVDHTEIMPKECLPCFNSALIEQFLYRIPGLSEHFLYANDDMLINRSVTPQTFFTEDDKPLIFMHRRPFRKLVLWYREKVQKKALSLYMTKIRYAARLVEGRYGKYYGGKPHHNIDAYTKSMFVVTEKQFGKELRAMYSHHMRSLEDIQRIIYSYVALAEKIGKLRYVSQKHSLRIQIHRRAMFKLLEKDNTVLFCVNDCEFATSDDRQYVIEFLSKMFPDKSNYEKM